MARSAYRDGSSGAARSCKSTSAPLASRFHGSFSRSGEKFSNEKWLRHARFWTHANEVSVVPSSDPSTDDRYLKSGAGTFRPPGPRDVERHTKHLQAASALNMRDREAGDA